MTAYAFADRVTRDVLRQVALERMSRPNNRTGPMSPAYQTMAGPGGILYPQRHIASYVSWIIDRNLEFSSIAGCPSPVQGCESLTDQFHPTSDAY